MNAVMTDVSSGRESKKEDTRALWS
jgi:hypothetical protein